MPFVHGSRLARLLMNGRSQILQVLQDTLASIVGSRGIEGITQTSNFDQLNRRELFKTFYDYVNVMSQ